MTYKRKKYHQGDTHLKKRWRVRNRRKDLDQIDDDLKEEKADKLLNQETDLDLPGAAQHYCLHCARYFIDDRALSEHFKTKVHKRRLKALELEPYSVEESERAAGFGSYKQPQKRKIVTQKTESIVRNSALFVNGLKATETYVHITPQVNFPNNVEKEQIKNDLLKRHSLFDFNKLENVWAMYEELKQRKICYEEERSKTSSELTKLMKDSSDNDKVNKLKIQCNLIKENIKMLKKPFLSAELTAMVELLKLPNKLHSKVSDQENIIHTHLLIPKSNKNHLEIGRQLNIITFKRNENYYLLGDAAIFELGAKFRLSKILRQRKFTQFSNNDFVKSVVVEGCGEDHTNPKSTFILQHDEASKVNIDNRLHLTGAGSLTSFFAYHAKNVIYSKVLPLKYFTLGRQYSPSPSDEDSLFHVSQSSVVQLFEVLKDDVEQENAFQEVIDIVKDFYNDLGYHYRLNLLPANKLLMWESLRLSIEMFSSSLNNYVEVGNVSLTGDFLSKRLMFTFVEKKEHFFPFIISGTLLNVPKLLGCVLEQDKDFAVPQSFVVSNWSI